MQLREMLLDIHSKGFSQADIAQKIEVNQSTISRIINGQDTSHKIAQKITRLYKQTQKQQTPSGN